MALTYKTYAILMIGGSYMPMSWIGGKSQKDVIQSRSDIRESLERMADTGTLSHIHSGFGEAYRAHHGVYPAYRDGYSFTVKGNRASYAYWIVEE